MDNWIIWEMIALQRLEERSKRRPLPVEELRPGRPGLRRRLATLLVAAGVHLDAEAGRAVLSPLRNHS